MERLHQVIAVILVVSLCCTVVSALIPPIPSHWAEFQQNGIRNAQDGKNHSLLTATLHV